MLLASQKNLYNTGSAHCHYQKLAADTAPTYALYGRLYISKSGWLLLSVPNSMARGVFDALEEPGVELPTKDGIFNAHISVMTREEVDSIGGPSAISERGHSFAYNLGPIKTVVPETWDGVSKVWFIEVQSPELKTLRKSYGLSPLPNEDHQFHITVAIRKRSVLLNNSVKKSVDLKELADIKADSDKRNYPAKTHRLRSLVAKNPEEWTIKSDKGHYSFEHVSGYKYHIPTSKMK